MSFDLFANISLERLKSLYELSKNNSRNISDLELTYKRNHNCLQENLNFLIDINLFKIKQNKIFTIKFEGQEFIQVLLNKLSKKPIYASLIKNYLGNFLLNSDNLFIFKPENYYNRVTSDLRNFLIDIKVIKLIDDHYVILKNDTLSLFKKSKFSPEQLKKRLKLQEQFGQEAEKLIFLNEVKIVKKINKNLKPTHIALDDTSAGYDILSYEKYKGTYRKIFIEVKAISRSNYEFHLSINESQIANKYGETYYLYLVPRDFTKLEKFDLKRIIKINNLDKNIFKNKKKWKVSPDGFLIIRV